MKEEKKAEAILSPDELRARIIELSEKHPTTLVLGKTKWETNYKGFKKSEIEQDVKEDNFLFINGFKPTITFLVHEYIKLYLSKSKTN